MRTVKASGLRELFAFGVMTTSTSLEGARRASGSIAECVRKPVSCVDHRSRLLAGRPLHRGRSVKVDAQTFARSQPGPGAAS